MESRLETFSTIHCNSSRNFAQKEKNTSSEPMKFHSSPATARIQTLVFAALLLFSYSQVSHAQRGGRPATLSPLKKLKTEKGRTDLLRTLEAKQAGKRDRVEAFARNHGLATKGKGWFVSDIEDGRPIYIGHDNQDVAISSNVDQVRNVTPYDLTGAGINVGVWDGGRVLSNHNEFLDILFGDTLFSRATNFEPATVGTSDHATHVAGTIGAGGSSANAMGMAPRALLSCFDSVDSIPEMANFGATGTSGNVVVSNHSYGPRVGWNPRRDGTWRWMGANGQNGGEDADFGKYIAEAADFDTTTFATPYHLAMVSAGNDRNDTPPIGAFIRYWNGTAWVPPTGAPRGYQPGVDPAGDPFYSGGFDVLRGKGVSKNTLTVGAVQKAISTDAVPVRNLAAALPAAFTNYGPTDDGRIKPDVVAAGVGVRSPDDTGVNRYDTKNGTSMATPAVTGVAALLQELWKRELDTTPETMRADLLKALLIHTADDIGMPGPDYQTGYGLVNAQTAADVILDHADRPAAKFMNEGQLSATTNAENYNIYNDGSSEFVATLCWSEPGTVGIPATLDDPTQVIGYEISLIVEAPDGSVVQSFAMDRLAPTNPATQTGSQVDNVQQVRIPAGESGIYRVTVFDRAETINEDVDYALVITGQAPELNIPSIAIPIGSLYPWLSDFVWQGFPIPGGVQVSNPFSTPIDVMLQNLGQTPWLQGQLNQPLTIPPGDTISLPYIIDASLAQGAPGILGTDLLLFDLTNNTSTVFPVRVTIPGAATDHTQIFPGAFENASDLSFRQILFDRTSASTYESKISKLSKLGARLPSETVNAITIPPGGNKDFSHPVGLNAGVQFPFYGVNYTNLWVNANGSITFAADTNADESLLNQLQNRKISILFDDFDPTSGGRVSYEQFHDRFVASWEGVPETGIGGASTFQLELFWDGRIRKTFLELEAPDGIVGISPGGGMHPDFVERNLTSLPPLDNGQPTQVFEAPGSSRELFDLDFSALTFTPTSDGPGSISSYDVCVSTGLTTLPSDPANGQTINITGVNGSHEVVLSPIRPITYFGGIYDRFWINTNGSITFGGASSASSGTLSEHLSSVRIAGLFRALDAQQVRYEEQDDRIAITWLNVSSRGQADSNTFQIELFFDGTLQMSYLGVDASEALVGLSSGAGQPIDFLEADFSETTPCALPEVIFVTDSATASEFGTSDTLSFRVIRDSTSALPLTVNFSVDAVSSTASAADYTGLPSSVTIPAGARDATFDISVIPDNLIEGIETLVLQLTPDSTYTLGTPDLAQAQIADKPFDQWQQQYFGSGAQPGSGDLQDPDGDGMNNLLEYAFGSDPTTPTPQRRLATALEVVDSQLIVDFIVDDGLEDITYQAQYSRSLGSWTDIDAVPVVVPDPEFDFPPGLQMLRVTTPMPVNAADRAFVRIQVTRQD